MSDKAVVPLRGPGAGREELEELYRQHWVPLLRFAWMLTSSRTEAEDIVQDVFVRYGQLSSTPRIPFAYLKRMVANKVHDNFRHLQVERRELERMEGEENPVEQPTDETVLHVWQTVDQLEEPQRTTIILRYYGSFTPEEIAESMECSVGTVKSRLSRALAKLRAEGL